MLKFLILLESELDLRQGTITLLSPDNSEIKIEVAHNISLEKSRKVSYKMGEGITGRVIETGKAIIVPKVSQEPLFLNRFERSKDAGNEISFICVPISIGRKIIGTISIDRIYDQNRSLDEDKRVVSIVASMIANDVKSRQRSSSYTEKSLKTRTSDCAMNYRINSVLKILLVTPEQCETFIARYTRLLQVTLQY